jgi:ribosomal protein S18 acetylase RimI-like enzyme
MKEKVFDDLEIRIQAPGDIEPVADIVKATGFFREDECDVAAEVLNDCADPIRGSDYFSYVALYRQEIAGWVCLGPVACTIGAFDIYWLVVAPLLQGRGIGSKLLSFAHNDIKSRRGRLAVIETSGTAKYLPTQRFYEANGYELCARLKDFYAPGDSKLIYINYLDYRTSK